MGKDIKNVLGFTLESFTYASGLWCIFEIFCTSSETLFKNTIFDIFPDLLITTCINYAIVNFRTINLRL